MSDNTQKTVAENTIRKCLDSEVGRKIIISKMLCLTEENTRMKRKVANTRIAVFTLNELSRILTRMLDHNYSIMRENQVPFDKASQKHVTSLTRFTTENYGEEMISRIQTILNDTEGDEILLRDLLGDEGCTNG